MQAVTFAALYTAANVFLAAYALAAQRATEARLRNEALVGRPAGGEPANGRLRSPRRAAGGRARAAAARARPARLGDPDPLQHDADRPVGPAAPAAPPRPGDGAARPDRRARARALDEMSALSAELPASPLTEGGWLAEPCGGTAPSARSGTASPSPSRWTATRRSGLGGGRPSCASCRRRSTTSSSTRASARPSCGCACGGRSASRSRTRARVRPVQAHAARRPGPGRHARAGRRDRLELLGRPALPGEGTRVVAEEACASEGREASVAESEPIRVLIVRRPPGRAPGPADVPRPAGRHRRGRRGRRRAGGGRAGGAAGAGRRAHGHRHAPARRHRGDPAHQGARARASG